MKSLLDQADHAALIKGAHDDRARQDFAFTLRNLVTSEWMPATRTVFDKRASPVFQSANGTSPNSPRDIRKAMDSDSWYRFYLSARRTAQELIWESVIPPIAATTTEPVTKGPDLDPSVIAPRYMSAIDIHCMPGGYAADRGAGDMAAGAVYDRGVYLYMSGLMGPRNDAVGALAVAYLKAHFPDFAPCRILDLGCTIGHNIVPLALAFPDCEVIAIDTAAPSLRYGHARAQSLGAYNLTFMQMNAEALDFPDGHFDWVQTTMYLHELSGKALPRVIREGVRVMAAGGLMLHLEQPQYSDEMPLYEQFIRDWDAFNNNEPFWSAMHALDLKSIMVDAGLPRENLFVTGVRAVVDEAIFPRQDSGAEDHGRAAVWNAYGAWKPA